MMFCNNRATKVLLNGCMLEHLVWQYLFRHHHYFYSDYHAIFYMEHKKTSKTREGCKQKGVEKLQLHESKHLMVSRNFPSLACMQSCVKRAFNQFLTIKWMKLFSMMVSYLVEYLAPVSSISCEYHICFYIHLHTVQVVSKKGSYNFYD